jgi:hypothetical protein
MAAIQTVTFGITFMDIMTLQKLPPNNEIDTYCLTIQGKTSLNEMSITIRTRHQASPKPP